MTAAGGCNTIAQRAVARRFAHLATGNRERGKIMTKLQRIYKALRVTTILSKRECRKAAIKLVKMHEKGEAQ
jgi:hypothetical protein